VPIEIQNGRAQIRNPLQPTALQVGLKLGVGALVLAKPYVLAMLNDGTASCQQEEVSVLWVMDSDLVGAQVDLAVDGRLDEASSTDTAHIELTILQAFDVQGLDVQR